jgi:hypothetical protein
VRSCGCRLKINAFQKWDSFKVISLVKVGEEDSGWNDSSQVVADAIPELCLGRARGTWIPDQDQECIGGRMRSIPWRGL